MISGAGIETLGIMVKFTMSREAAESVKARFEDRSARGECVSYLDCVLVDTALGVLGMEQAYYGTSDDEWREMSRQREEEERRYAEVKVIDITDWVPH